MIPLTHTKRTTIAAAIAVSSSLSLFAADTAPVDIEGTLERVIPVPMDMVTNCTFGGEDGRMLFVTAGHTLRSLRLK